jgi:hypothetical protein
MYIAFVTFILLLVTRQLEAQAVGDSVRVRLHPRADWVAGRIVQADTMAFTLRSALESQQYRLAEVARVDRWKRDKLILRVLGCTAGGVAGWELGRAVAHHSKPATSSRGGDIALSAGIGVVFGLVSYAIAPGSRQHSREIPGLDASD